MTEEDNMLQRIERSPKSRDRECSTAAFPDHEGMIIDRMVADV